MDAAPFAHAVASFEPTADGVLLWTHVAPPHAEVRWEVARDPELRSVVASGSSPVLEERGRTVTVDVRGLAPETTYWYRFSVGGARSPVGRTRTLPAVGSDGRPFTIATVCCARYSVAPLGVYRAVAEREVDLVVHLGDYIYEDDGSAGPRRHDPPHAATTLDDYRRRIAQVRADPDAQALHLRHPMVAIWDDHDLADNAWRDGAKAHDEAEHGPWARRVAAAARARAEWLPSRSVEPERDEVTWRSLPIGDLAELVLLDTRLVGRDLQAGDPGAPDRDDPARSLLGPEQRRWLGERLADVARPWTIVASGVVVNEIALPWPRALRWIGPLLPNGYAVLDGEVLHDDQWDGYPAERERMVGWMRDRGRAGARTLLLSGDVHSSWAFEGPEVDGRPVAVEATTPAVSSDAMGRARLPGLWRLLDRQANRLAHVHFAEVTERGYATLELTTTTATFAWWHVDPWAQDPGGREERFAAHRTRHEDWPPRLEVVAPEGTARLRGAVDHPGGLPPRPRDLARLRRRRTARLAGELAGAVIAASAAALLGVRAARAAGARAAVRSPSGRVGWRRAR